MNGQCDGVCSQWYDCCKQPGLCLNNGECLPSESQKIWTRFKCKCPNGFHGNRCERPITTCDDVHRELSQESGVYKVVDASLTSYEVYCDFNREFNATWTLVQSYSRQNASSNSNLPITFAALYENTPLSENRLDWRGYRLSKTRMQEIVDNSQLLLFTCNYEKTLHLNESDYVKMQLPDLHHDGNLLSLNDTVLVSIEQGNIGGQSFGNCKAVLVQNSHETLHVHVYYSCGGFKTPSISIQHYCLHFNYFGNYRLGYDCLDKTHRCLQSPESTTQLWFGRLLP